MVISTIMLSCGNGRSENNAVKPEKEQSISFVWQDSFTVAQKNSLSEWIGEVYHITEELLGPFPFKVAVHFHLRSDASEPVPWAHTRRSGKQELHFHVDPEYHPEAFWNDWTAPHEISHLALPFVGKRHAWFSEGFATYMQNLVQESMGTMTAEEVRVKLKEKINYNRKFFEGETEPFDEIAQKLVRKNHNYPAMYWGGASFFLRMDQALQKEGKSLPWLISAYQDPCRMKDKNLNELINSLDSLLGKPMCAELIDLYTNKPATEVFEGLSL